MTTVEGDDSLVTKKVGDDSFLLTRKFDENGMVMVRHLRSNLPCFQIMNYLIDIFLLYSMLPTFLRLV